MARKKRGRKMPVWKKWTKAIVGTATGLLGVLIAFSPAVRGAKTIAGGNIDGGGRQILYDYTGINLDSGGFESQKAVVGIGTVVGAILLVKLLRFVGRSV